MVEIKETAMAQIWNYLKGKKTYIGLAAGGIVVLLNHVGIHVPGVTLDQNAYTQQLWALLIGAATRHGISTGA